MHRYFFLIYFCELIKPFYHHTSNICTYLFLKLSELGSLYMVLKFSSRNYPLYPKCASYVRCLTMLIERKLPNGVQQSIPGLRSSETRSGQIPKNCEILSGSCYDGGWLRLSWLDGSMVVTCALAPKYTVVTQETHLTNPTMHLTNIPQCTIL